MSNDKSDIKKLKAQILQKLNIRQEYEQMGVRFVGHPNKRGWNPCFNPYKSEQHPSCGINTVDDARLGQLVAFNLNNGGSAVWCKSIFDVASDFVPGLGGEFVAALRYYAAKTGIELHDKGNHKSKEIDRQYDYCDATGALKYQVIRYKGRKNFMPHRPDPLHPSRWIYDLPENMRLPYGLNKVATAETIYIVEGEKDCQTLEALGLCASTNPFGAGKWVDAYNQHFAAKHIIILYDNDDPGKAHAQLVARNLQPVAATVRIVDLPGCENKEDVTDWLSKGHTLEELQQLVGITPQMQVGNTKASSKSIIEWTAGSYTDIARQIAPLMADTGRYYARGGSACEIQQQGNSPTIKMLKPSDMCSRFESVAVLTNASGEVTRANEQQAKLIICSEPFQNALPPLTLISQSAVLIERGGELVTITGYDRTSGIWAAGTEPQDVTLNNARQLLYEVLEGFNFVSHGDHARSLAAIITPALVFGGLLKGRVPLLTFEADESQTGKGHLNNCIAAFYGQTITTITQRKGGVGSIEEQIARAMISGSSFIGLDNLRGKIDLPSLESLLTSDLFLCRVPYHGDIPIDPKNSIFSATSNRAEFTRDLANRSSIIRILKQPEDYRFKTYPTGNNLDEIRANQSLYLGAVFTVVRAWHEAGKPKIEDAGHDFRVWSQTLGWISEKLLNTCPLMEGHKQAKERTANPALSWLRDLALLVTREGYKEPLRAHDILDILLNSDIEVPGFAKNDNPDDDDTRKRLLQALGRKFAQVFKTDEILIDDIKCSRMSMWDEDKGRDIKTYFFEISPYEIPITPSNFTCELSNLEEKSNVSKLPLELIIDSPYELPNFVRKNNPSPIPPRPIPDFNIFNNICIGDSNGVGSEDVKASTVDFSEEIVWRPLGGIGDIGGHRGKTEAIDTNLIRKNNSSPIEFHASEACFTCDKMTPEKYCRQYGKPAEKVMYCTKKEQSII